MSVQDQQFERDKASFEQNNQHARALNQIMWQVPTIALTLTGGLWYAVATLKGVDAQLRAGLLGFGVVGNVVLAMMVSRVRDVLEAYLDKIQLFNPPTYPSVPSEYSLWPFRLGGRGVQRTFTSMMVLAALASLYGAWGILAGWFGANMCP